MHMKLYKIDSGIKLPTVSRRSNGGRPTIAFATLEALKPGQSFLVRDAAEAFVAAKVMRDLKMRDRRVGAKRDFASRQVKTGTRLWRTK